MAGKKPSKAQADKEDRLKAALKANMAKRKAQARARANPAPAQSASRDGKEQADG